jgi:hypothetical protein
MTRSVVASLTIALLFGGVVLLPASPALAKKKKASSDEPAVQVTDDSPAPGKSADQVGDTEKPKSILDTSQDAPKTDSLGHVHFGSPSASGIGRVAVKASPESKIKIFLEGRYFGTAPLTIYSVPKGDYIVEAVFANGKQLSRPVTVNENEETAFELEGAQALKRDSGPGVFDAEMTPTRMTWTKVGLVTAGVGAVAAITFGVLVLKTEGDYEKASGQAEMDDLKNKGDRYALLTNVGIAVCAVGVITAGIAGYPLVMRPSEKSKTALWFTPTGGPGMAGAAATLRF